MRRPFSSPMLTLVLLVTAALPSFVFMVFHTSSMAAGILVVSGVYVLLFALLGGIRWRVPRLGTVIIRVTTALGVVFAQGAVSMQLHSQFDFGRFLQSCLLLVLVFLATLSFALLARKVPDHQADFAVRWNFYVLLLVGIMGIFSISPFSPDWRKPVVFFSEPSHFALSFLPFLLYMVVNASAGRKLLLVLSGYALAVLIENLTLAVGVTLIAALTLPLRRSLLLAFIVTAAIWVGSVNLDYFTARVDMSGGTQNLSTMVYLSGWERACQDFSDTFGLGVGFQQFGIIGSRGDEMESIAALVGADLNLLNGGTVAPKFIGEFGVIALAMLLAYLVYFAKCAKWLREVSRGAEIGTPARVFFLSCVVMYSVDLFVRGPGYFSSSGFLFVAATVWLVIEGREMRAVRQGGRFRKEAAAANTSGPGGYRT